MKSGIGAKLPDCITLLGSGFSSLLFALITAPKFTSVFLVFIPLIIFLARNLNKNMVKYSIKEFSSYGQAGKIAQECLSSIRTVISLGIQKKSVTLYETNLDTANEMGVKKGLAKGIFSGLFQGVFQSLFAITVFWATYLVRSDCENYSPCLVLAAFYSILNTTNSLGFCAPFFGIMGEAKAAFQRIMEIIETKSDIDIFQTSDQELGVFEGSISFENIFFKYPQRPESTVLNGLDLELPIGKTIAICGASGSGKSTIVSLLERFYSPISGRIKIDGKDIAELNVVWLRNQMALVSQEPTLFGLSIKENIRLGDLDATDAEVELELPMRMILSWGRLMGMTLLLVSGVSSYQGVRRRG